jgi:hypothetical protein
MHGRCALQRLGQDHAPRFFFAAVAVSQSRGCLRHIANKNLWLVIKSKNEIDRSQAGGLRAYCDRPEGTREPSRVTPDWASIDELSVALN